MEKEHRFCPQCYSTELYWFMGGRLGDIYKCRECGYQGIALVGDEEFIKELKEKEKINEG
ncbi:MAG: hypothetical protein ABIE23_01295 [archaeon]